MEVTKNKPNTILLKEIGKACREEGLEIYTEIAQLNLTSNKCQIHCTHCEVKISQVCAKIFLKNKDELTYDRMLQLLKGNALDAGFDLKPECFQMHSKR